MLTKRDNGSATKRGPGRLHVQGDGTKTMKQRKVRYADGAVQAQRQRNLAKPLHPLRDEHGAYTLTGSPVEFVDCRPGAGWREIGGSSGPDGFTVTACRIWLAGISAQRGY
jgi:hypothetical protein